MNVIKNLSAIMLLLLAFTAQIQASTDAIEDANCSILYAGQHTPVGTVCVTINETDVNLDYLLIDGWVLTEAHAWIGDNLANMPQTPTGNPKIGLFPYAVSGLSGTADYSFLVPISELPVNADTFCSAEILVAAHAVVKRPGTSTGSDDTDDGESPEPGKSSKSSKSGKDTGKSAKSGKDSQSGKSAKSGKDSGKSVKAAKTKNTKSAGKGYKVHDAKFGPVIAATDAGKSSKSGKSGKSSKSGKSTKSGAGSGDDSGAGSGSGGQTESAWAGTISLGGGSWATYFSFVNDCGTTEEPEDPELPSDEDFLPDLVAGCANVFALGETSFYGAGLAAQGSVGSIISLPASGITTYTLSDGQISYGTVSVNILNAQNALLMFTADSNWRFNATNIHTGSLEGFDVDPRSYSQSEDLGAAASFGQLISLNGGPSLVIHAIACVPGVTPAN